MSVRAVILDVYRTLLEVHPPPADAEDRWHALARPLCPEPGPPTLAELERRTSAIVTRHHDHARRLGIRHPEVDWETVFREALPFLDPLPPPGIGRWVREHAALTRTTRLAPGAATVLTWLRLHRVPLGIASNAQAYTLAELTEALGEAGLCTNLFDPDLCFWSFQHGFSKPDPGVFRFLARRLAARGIAPHETLMVGDRSDNDIAPAQAAGWQAWHLDPAATPSRGWKALLEVLSNPRSAAFPPTSPPSAIP